MSAEAPNQISKPGEVARRRLSMRIFFCGCLVAVCALIPFFVHAAGIRSARRLISEPFRLFCDLDLAKFQQQDPRASDACADWKLGDGHGNPKIVHDELVLVTGGAGFIGSSTVELLVSLGYHVRIMDNLETGNILYVPLDHPNVEFLFGDINSKFDLETAMNGVSGVIHLAAASKVAPSLKDPKMATFNVVQNSVGTANVLEVANSTKKVQKVVYAASSTYYGNQPVPFVESDLFSPSSPYAASKYMGELQMDTFDSLYGLPCLNLRFFMVYGPRNPQTGPYALVTGKFVTQMLDGQNLTIEGDGMQYRDFIHVKDIARGIVLGLQNPAARGMSINLGSGTKASIQDVADLVSPNQVYRPRRKNDLDGTLADTCLAKQALDFETRFDFLTEMGRIVELAKQKKDKFFMSFWLRENIAFELNALFPNWVKMSTESKNDVIRSALHDDPNFLTSLLKKVT